MDEAREARGLDAALTTTTFSLAVAAFAETELTATATATLIATIVFSIVVRTGLSVMKDGKCDETAAEIDKQFASAA